MQKRAGLLTIFSLFLLLSIISIFFFRHQLSSFPRSAAEIVIHPIQRSLFSAFGGFTQNYSSNVHLRLSNQELANQIVSRKELEREAKALRDQYDLKIADPKELIPARVVGMKSFIPGVSYPEEIILDKGALQGVRQGQVVVLTNNVVGNIAEVTENRSLVRLLTNTSQALTGTTVRTEAIGVIRGKGSGVMTLENVILADILEKGDIVITHGDETMEGRGYPPELVIGRITSVDKKASDLFQSAEIESLVDFSSLHTVFIIKSDK